MATSHADTLKSHINSEVYLPEARGCMLCNINYCTSKFII